MNMYNIMSAAIAANTHIITGHFFHARTTAVKPPIMLLYLLQILRSMINKYR